MRRIVYLPAARRDLLDIWTYIAERDERAADRLLDDIKEAARLLAELPYSAPAAESVRPGLRKKSVRGYIIFYRVIGGSIRIGRVLHGARDAIWQVL